MLDRMTLPTFVVRLASVSMIATCGVLLASGPSVAQRASPEIKAEERSDPAAGETVVIINSDKTRQTGDTKRQKAQASQANSKSAQSKGNAPNPYAPIKLKPLPENKQRSDQAATEPPASPRANRNRDGDNRIRQSSRPRSIARPPKTTTRIGAVAPRRLPPLPELNTERQTARAEIARPETARPEAVTPRARINRRPQWRPGSRVENRNNQRRARRDRNQYNHAYGYGVERDRIRTGARLRRTHRPWNQCRKLAWRCEDGFRRACDIWRRRC